MTRSRWRSVVVHATVCAAFAFIGLPAAVADGPDCVYDADTRTLDVKTAAGRRFRYAFNPGGAVCGLHDRDLAPQVNLVGDSFQGEATDRVIQWTYWNARYLAAPHASGDGDRRANVTMEGCFGGTPVCDVLDSPPSGHARTLTFRSRITHWFYSELDRHGHPDFETTTRYEILDDGSLRLDRDVTRRPWKLSDVVVRKWAAGQWADTGDRAATLQAEHLGPGSFSSYFEGWTPLRRTALPLTRHGTGPFDKDGYRFWIPNDLGGWAMAYGDTQAVAVVFGTAPPGNAAPGDVLPETRQVFNKLDIPEHNLTVLLPGIEASWPDDGTLRQTLILVVGTPDDVRQRATRWSPMIPAAAMQPR